MTMKLWEKKILTTSFTIIFNREYEGNEQISNKQAENIDGFEERVHVEKMSSKATPIGLLKNGSGGSSLKSVTIGEDTFMVTNTCAFDAVVQCLACAYADSGRYQEFVKWQDNKEESLWKIVIQMNSFAISKWTYKSRAQILKQLYESQEMDGINLIQAEIVVGDLCNKLFRDYPSLTKSCDCSVHECSVISAVPTISVQVGPNNEFSLHKIVAEYVAGDERSCIRHEEESHESTYHQSPVHLIFEMLPHINFEQIHDTDVISGPELNLHHLPTSIEFGHITYHLRGAVGSSSRKTKDFATIGHYVAYCRRSNSQWELYNDLNSKSLLCDSNEKITCELLYYGV